MNRRPSILSWLRKPAKAHATAWLMVVALLSQGWLSVPLGVRMGAAAATQALAGSRDVHDSRLAADAHEMAADGDELCSDLAPASPAPDAHHDHDNCLVCQSALQPLLLAAAALDSVLDRPVAPPETVLAAALPERNAALGYRSRAPPQRA